LLAYRGQVLRSSQLAYDGGNEQLSTANVSFTMGKEKAGFEVSMTVQLSSYGASNG
jgi:hypothetical protein